MRSLLYYTTTRNGVDHWRFQKYVQHSYNRLSRKAVFNQTQFPICDSNYIKAHDTLVFQVSYDQATLSWLTKVKEVNPDIQIIGMWDDLGNYEDIPLWIRSREFYKDKKETTCGLMTLADKIVTTTEHLKKCIADRFSQPLDKICCLPNFISASEFPVVIPSKKTDNFKKIKSGKRKPKIGICCTLNHLNTSDKFQPSDFNIISDTIRSTCGIYEWNIIGSIDTSMNDLVFAGKVKHCAGSSIDNYIKYVGSLDLDAFVAPLRPCDFNLSKSMIKVKESYACFIPCFVSDVGTYDRIVDDQLFKFKDGDDLKSKLNEYFSKSAAFHENLLTKNIQKLQEEFKLDGNTWNGYILENNLSKIDEVFFKSNKQIAAELSQNVTVDDDISSVLSF